MPQLQSISEYEPNTTHRENDGQSIVLRVNSRPSLEAQYTLILEMRMLLQLRSLYLSNFHITEKGDWAFVVSGDQDMMGDWVEENRLATKVQVNRKPYRSCSTTVSLILGIIVGLLVAGGPSHHWTT